MDAITLANRLWSKTPFGYSGTWFSHGGRDVQGYAALIEYVMERYARRFGMVSNDNAERFHARLAAKYCNSHPSTMRALRGPGVCKFVYPVQECAQLDIRLKTEVAALEQMQKYYKYPEAEYCEINAFNRQHCECCGALVWYLITGKHGLTREVYSAVQLNGWRVCRDRRCRAVAAYTKRGRGKLPLINVLLELAKNGKNNTTYKRGLEKHFVRHA